MSDIDFWGLEGQVTTAHGLAVVLYCIIHASLFFVLVDRKILTSPISPRGFQHPSATHRNISGAQMEIEDGLRPLKRVRTDVHKSSSSATSPLSTMPPLSLSILGVEPVDEFIREVADFIHHMISMHPRDLPGAMVEVEAKIGILRDRLSGNRLNLPVLTETSESAIHQGCCPDTLTCRTSG